MTNSRDSNSVSNEKVGDSDKPSHFDLSRRGFIGGTSAALLAAKSTSVKAQENSESVGVEPEVD